MDEADLSRLRIARDAGRDAATSLRARRFRLALLGLAGVSVLLAAVALTREKGVLVQTGIAVSRGGGGAGGAGLTANGYVVARTKASVSSKVPGRLASLAYEEGDHVAAGAVIARLEAAEYAAGVGQAEAEVLSVEAQRHEALAALVQARRARDRARTLAASSLLAEQAREDAETGVDVAEARLAAMEARLRSARYALDVARANLENTFVRAPFSGTVLRKDAEVGEVVAPSVGGGLTRGAVVTLADLSTLEVEVDVNEAYIASITSAQPAEIVLDAYPRERFAGRVRQVVPTADRQKATVLVRVAIDSDDPRILPEMGARVTFRDAGAESPGETSRVFVPARSVRTDGSTTIVFVVSGARVQRRVIEAGPVSGAEREVRSGLNGGEQLVLDPPAGLSDGARVRVAEPGRGTGSE